MRDADLFHANLSGCYARDAVFDRSSLSHAIFDGADLEGASFNDTYLIGTSLDHAWVHDADMSHAIGLTQQKITQAFGSRRTQLPPKIAMPGHWLDGDMSEDAIEKYRKAYQTKLERWIEAEVDEIPF